MEQLEEAIAQTLAALGVDERAAQLAYRNDFSSTTRAGRSDGPAGQGPLRAHAACIVPFHYSVVVDSLADGVHAARFPTGAEQPGGGPGYSWFGCHVVGRGALLQQTTAWAFTVHVPPVVELAVRSPYLENRFVASVGRENIDVMLGVRFDGPDELVWVQGHDGRPHGPDSAQVLDRLPLGARLVGGERLRFAFAVDVRGGRAAVAVRCDERGIAVASVAPRVVALDAANVIAVSSSGNALSSDDDPNLFFRLSDVVAYRAG